MATTVYPIRRQRRFLLPSSPDNKYVSIPLMVLLLRTGVGLLAGPDSDPPVLGVEPQVMWRFSRDGGKTWGPERSRSAHRSGRFKGRVRFLNPTGNYRNGVGEITVSDPVDWQFVAMLGEVVEGSH